jgi:16S rRNA (guanine966-N2)-methyltransferase
MSIKILGGRLKDLPLFCPTNLKLRPTSVLLRRRIFDANQDLSGHVFVDCCAGVGTMGLEAFSRGADKIIFNEINPKHVSAIKKNIQSAQAKSENFDYELTTKDVLKWLDSFKEYYQQLTEPDSVIFFLDPPYEMIDLYTAVIEKLKSMNYAGILWVEACRQKTVSIEKLEEKTGLFDKVYKQGTSYLGVKDFS